MKVEVINLDSKKAGAIELDDAIFKADIRNDLMSRVVNWQLASRRLGCHKVKGRSEVNATKSKPFRQKGSGRARQGTRVASQMRGGGIVFGPHYRDHSTKIPKKVRKLALKSALSCKYSEGKVVVLDKLSLKSNKTSELKKKLAKLEVSNAIVITGGEVDSNFKYAVRNLMGIDVLPSHGANVYDILRRDVLILTKDGVSNLSERLR